MKNLYILLIISGLCACHANTDQDLAPFKNRINMQLEISEKVTVLYTDSGYLRAKLTAPVVHNYSGNDPYQEMPKGIKAYTYYVPSGELASSITANYAIRKQGGGSIEARNKVVITNTKGDTLNTEQIFWQEKEKRIYTNKFVRIATPNKIFFGDGLEANQEFTRYRIIHLRGVATVNENQASF
jgi:LPS export ABC transporter protein LptC